MLYGTGMSVGPILYLFFMAPLIKKIFYRSPVNVLTRISEPEVNPKFNTLDISVLQIFPVASYR